MTKRPIGEKINAKVVKILNNGAIVSFDQSDSAFLHISELSTKYVKQVSDVLKAGQNVQVEIVDKKDGKTFVSMKNVVQETERKQQFEDRIQSFLKESMETQRLLQKSLDKKQGNKKRKK